MNDQWWQDLKESVGEVSDMFSKLFTPLVEGVANDGLVDAVGFQSLRGKMNDYRDEHNGGRDCDIRDFTVEMVKKWWADSKFADRIDVLTAVRFTWILCNEA